MARFVRTPASQHRDLVDRLADELKEPEQVLDMGKDLPLKDELVIEETPGYGPGRYMISVVWQAWENLAPEERGQVILDAIAETRGEEHRLKVGLALGLTPDEYQRLRASGGLIA
jgi:hypothetical protein